MQTVAGEGRLPIRYIQHGKVIDLYRMYMSWLNTRSSESTRAAFQSLPTGNGADNVSPALVDITVGTTLPSK
jgi:hypothetical protein